MKLFELFRPRQAAATTESVDVGDIPTPDACNCADVFFGDKAAEVKSAVNAKDPDSLRGYHTSLVNKIANILSVGNEERPKARKTFEQMRRTEPTTDEQGKDWWPHVLMHLSGAGKSPTDLVTQTETTADGAGTPRSLDNTEYGPESCNTCSSYLTELQEHANSFKQSMGSKIEKLPEDQKPYAQMSVKGLFKRMWDSWTNKQPIKDNDHPMVKKGNDLLKKWNKHTEQDHGTSLDPGAFTRYTKFRDAPVSGESLDKFYKRLQGLALGWSVESRPDVPLMSDETRKQIEETYPFQNVYQSLDVPDIDWLDVQAGNAVAKDMREKGELNDYTLPSTIEHAVPDYAPGALEEARANQVVMRDKSTSNEWTAIQFPKPIGYEGATPGSPLRVVEIENLTGLGRGTNFTTQRKTVQRIQNYDPSEVQKERWMTRPVEYSTELKGRPEIKQTWTNHKHDGTCDHESHAVSLDPTEEQTACDGWHADDMTDLTNIPREDAFLFQKAGVKPDLALHKENIRSISPIAENKQKAYENYNTSYNQALATAYPGMSRDEALDSLYAEHQETVNRLNARRERFRTSSKKEGDMPTFNSRNDKTAHVDPSAVAHGIAHGVGWLMDKGRQLLHDMNNPVTHSMSKGDQATGNQILQQAEGAAHAHNGLLQDRYMSEYTNYMDSHSQPHLNLVGAEADAAALASPFIIKKHLGSFNERFAAEKKPCPDCGKSCKDKVECKQNQDERRRQNAAENSSY